MVGDAPLLDEFSKEKGEQIAMLENNFQQN
jgi:hypothetical protein